MKKRLSLDEIAERLALPKTTVYYWIADLPLGRERRENGHPGNVAMQAKYRRLREEAYAKGQREYDELSQLPTFRDFVALYIAEGYKRSRNTASVSNSDRAIVSLTASWFRRLSGKTPRVSVQYHADKDPAALAIFWGKTLAIDPSAVRLHPKTNSARLRTRVWRCRYGVAAIALHDTALRARIDAWIDRIRQDWRLDSAGTDGA
jgi:hypothetical protein